MKQKELRPVCSLGMFDFFKGYAIIMVLLEHTLDLTYKINSDAMIVIDYYISIIGGVTMSGLFIVAGYNIRKRPIKKCLSQITKTYISSYIWTAIITVLLFFISHFLTFRYLPATISETLHLFSGFMLGQYPTGTYFKWTAYSCGPVWFLVAMTIGWFVFNLILNKCSLKMQWVVCGLCGLIGCYGKVIEKYGVSVPFCFFKFFSAVFLLFIGFIIKEKKLLEKKLSLLFVGVLCLTLYLSFTDFLLPLTYLARVAISVGLIYLLTHVNRRYNGLVNAFEKIGHNSIYILCLHTVEIYAIQWSWLLDKLNLSEIASFAVVAGLRVAFILAGISVVELYQKVGGIAGLKGLIKRKMPDIQETHD